jgi:hypothetical protein
LLGDLALEGQLLDRARYVKALAVAAKRPEVESLANRLITAHSATVDWLTTVLAEDVLGGPAALRRTPLQVVTGLAMRMANWPLIYSTRGVDWVLNTLRESRPAVNHLINRGAHVGEVAVKAAAASRDAALERAEWVTRRGGADGAADALHNMRSATGVLEPEELPIAGYADLNLTEAVAAVKDLTDPADIRAILAYEKAHKARQRVVSAAQTRVAAIAQEIVGID